MTRSGHVRGAGAVGAIIGPFIAGQIADRYLLDREVPRDEPPPRRGADLAARVDRELPGFLVFSLVYYGSASTRRRCR